MITIIVTRHPALVQYLREQGWATADTPVVTHAEPADVAGKHVIGVLPLHLAALAAQVTEVPMAIPAALRGHELTLAQVRQYAGEPVTYVTRMLARRVRVRQQYSVYPTREAALADGWPDAEYGTWAISPRSTSLVEGWIALDEAD